MRSRIPTRFIAAFTALFGIWNVAICQEKNDQMAAVAVAAEGYSNNIDSFTNFRCSFRISGHQANSIEDAIAGHFTGEIGHASEGLWLVKKPWERYLLTCDPAVIQSAKEQLAKPPVNTKGNYGVLKACMAQDYLSNGTFELTKGIFLSAAHLSQPVSSNMPVRNCIDPLRFDSRGPLYSIDSQLQKCVTKEWQGRFEGVRDLNGRNVMVIACAVAKDRFHSRFFLDPERGFLPLRDERYEPDTGKKRAFTLITDVISCPGGRWFPRRALIFSFNLKIGESAPYTNILEIKVTSLDVNANLKDADFLLTIPKGYQVTMPPNRFALLGLKDSSLAITPASMDKLHKQLLDSEQYWKAEAARNAILKKSTRGSYRLYFWIGQGCLLFAIFVIYIIYKRIRSRV